MGQMALGLLYGTVAPVLTHSGDNEAAVQSLLDHFHSAVGLPRWPPRVIQAAAGEPALLGVWVALGGSGAPGVAFLAEDPVPLEDVASLYTDATHEARTVWDQFAAYCTAQGQVEVPAARLWLTPTEVA